MTARPLFLLVAAAMVLTALAARPPRAPAQPAPAQPTASASPEATLDTTTVVDELVAEALRSNLGLRQETLALEQAGAALAEARGQYLPRLDVSARYTRSAGGRTIDFPIGDLLNPVYRTLNEQAAGRPFPEVDNQEIRFMREREQETTLQLRQPVFAPGIVYGSRARRHQRRAQQASVEAVRAELVRDVQVAYFRYRQAQVRVDVLDAALALVRENRRTNARLVDAGTATQEAVYRAEAEALAVQQQRDDARAQVDRARRFLNVLRNRPSHTSIPASSVSAASLVARHTAAVEQHLGRPLPLASPANPDGVEASPEVSPEVRLEAGDWTTRHPELRRLSAAVDAAEAQRRAAQTDFLPTISLAVDAGIQGETYGISGDKPFVFGSIVLRWNLFDGFQDRRAVDQRRLEVERLRTRRADTAQQLGLQVRTALDDVRVARQSLQTAGARVTAATESFRLTARRYDEGRANQVEFTDARTARTEAELNLNRTQYDLLICLAELDYALGWTDR